MYEEVVIGNARLIRGDCLEILPTLPKVDALITSPPYADQRSYEGNSFDWGRAAEFMAGIPAHESTQVLINCGLIHRGGPVEYWRGLFDGPIPWFGWYVWDQGFGLPGDWNGRLAPAFEFVFHFCHEAVQPNKTKPCVSRGRRLGNYGLRGKDDEVRALSHAGAPVNAERIPDSVIRVTREMRRDIEHPARFPEQFAAELVSAYSARDAVILDPFMGSGSTGVACADLGRKFVGIEIEPKYFDIACRRIEDAQRQQRLFA